VSFPTDSNVKTELLINGTWTDVSTRVRAERGATITRGRQNEQGRVSAVRAEFDLNNRNGDFSSRNPLSPYYGVLPRNTQVRVTAGTATTFIRYPYNDATTYDYAYTTDKAALDILGNIEVRVDVQPTTWRPRYFMILASKYATVGDQRSWVLYLSPDGTLRFRVSADGLNTTVMTGVTAVPVTSGRLSIKAVYVANNGAAGKSITFSTASAIGGVYTGLGSTVTTAGTLAIFSSTAPLVAGAGYDSARIFSDGQRFGGRSTGCASTTRRARWSPTPTSPPGQCRTRRRPTTRRTRG
jgi:hypothetical protein